MKRIFTKLLCLVAVLACVVSLAGCGAGSPAAEAEAKAAATGFMDALINLDISAAQAYLDDAEGLDSEFIESLSMDKVIEEAMAGNEAVAGFEDKIRPIFDVVIEKIKAVMSYEIVGSQMFGEDYVFDVKITSFDDEKTGEMENVLENAMSKHLTNEGMTQLATKLLEEGKISDQSSETEIIGAFFDELMPEITKSIEEMEIATKVIDGQVVVSEVDGKWLVNVMKSDLD